MQNLARDEAGNVWELDAQGNPVRLAEPAAPAQGRVFSLPPNPKDARQESRQSAADARDEAAAARQAAADARAAEKAERDAREWAATHNPDGSPKPKADPKEAARAPKLDSLVEQIRRVESLYKKNLKPEAYGILSSIGDLLPTPENKQFNTASAGLAEQGLAAFRVPGVGAQSDTELRQFVEANKPSASNYDTSIEEKLLQLKTRVDAERRGLGMTPVDWSVADQRADNEVSDPTNNAGLKPPPNPDVMDETTPIENSGQSGSGKSAASGASREVFDARLSAQIDALVNARAWNVANETLRKNNLAPISPGERQEIQKWMKQNPGKRYFGANISHTEDLSPLQRAAGSAPGAFVSHTGNAVTGGLVGALAGPEGQGALDAMAANNPGTALAGNVGGGTAGVIGAELMAIRAAAKAAPKLAAGVAARLGDTSFGAFTGFNQAREGEGGTGALIGGGAALTGGLIGNQIGKQLGRIGAPNVSGADRSILGTVKGDFDAVRPQLDEAQRLNLPLALADADPRLRTLAGAVSRKSVDARDLAERTFDPRQLGQADRAIDAIDSYLAPITDIAARGSQHIDNARLNSNPLYEAAKARAAPVDDEVAAILQSDAGQDALQRARRIASNEGRDPNGMGFDLDEQGDVVLRDAPSFETLDLVKRGFDSRLSEARNPVTGVLDLAGNPELQAIEGLRRRFVGRLDEINDVYPQARAAYATEAAKKDALDRGYKAPTSALPPRDLQRVVGGLDEAQVPEYQRGYATSLADAIERTRLTGNPYSAIHGSPAQMEKLGTVFPEGAPTFGRVADIEREMAKTRYEVMGGSPTAGRLQADDQIGGGLGSAVMDLGSQLATGGGLNLGSLINAGRRAVGDSLKLGVGKQAVKRADEIAPVLFDTNPRAAAAYLDELLARAAARAARSQAAGKVSGSLGAGTFTPLLIGP